MSNAAKLSEVEVFVFDLEGVLVEGMPYEEVLRGVSDITEVDFVALTRHYHDEWHGLDKAEEYHRSLTRSRRCKARISELYTLFTEKKAKPDVCAGAADLLRFIRDRLCRSRICWTRGDSKLQEQVLTNSGLLGFFDHVVISGAKNRAVFTDQVLPVLGERTFAMIGDSYVNDIESVAGHAKHRVWVAGSRANQYVEAPAEIARDVIRIQSIAELQQLLARKSNGRKERRS